MKNELAFEIQCREYPLVSFAHGLPANRGRRILRHEHRIRAVKVENGIDILVRKQALVSIQEFLELLSGASGFFRARSRLVVVANPAGVGRKGCQRKYQCQNNWQEA